MTNITPETFHLVLVFADGREVRSTHTTRQLALVALDAVRHPLTSYDITVRNPRTR